MAPRTRREAIRLFVEAIRESLRCFVDVHVYTEQVAARPDDQFPHMHVGWDLLAGEKPISKYHFPTGHIVLEDFLRLLVRDFGARPRRHDWGSILARTSRAITVNLPNCAL